MRGLAAHKRRLVSTVIAVLLGVAFMAGSLIFTDTMKQSLAGVYAEAEQGTDAVVRGPEVFEGAYGTNHEPVDASLVRRVAAVEGVAGVAPRIEGYAQVLGRDGEPIDDITKGGMPAGAAWSDVESLNPFRLVDGSAPAADSEVVVDRSVADAAELSVGDTVTVLTSAAPRTLEVSGIATFGDEDNRAGTRTVLFTPSAAASMLGRDGVVDSIAVAAAEGVSEEDIVSRLAPALGNEVSVVTGTALAAENADRGNVDVEFFGVFMTVMAVVALLVGAFIINNTFTILVAQRTRELALLRAIGASGRQVRRSVALEATVIGAMASALGLIGGVGIAKGIQILFRGFGVSLPDGSLVVEPRSLGIAFAVGFVITVVSALLPARRAAKIAPVAAMRSVSVDRTGTSKRRIVIGLVMLALSAAAVIGGILGSQVPPVMLGALVGFLGVAVIAPVLARPVVRVVGAVLPRMFGVRGRLARENAARNPRRTAATASALMIGVALVGAITVFANSAKSSITESFAKEFRGDLVLDSGAWQYGGLSPALSEDLAARPEVGAVAGKQFAQAQVGDSVTDLSGWPAASVEKVFDLGVSAGSVAGLGNDGIAVATAYAEDHGWQVGSTVPVTFGTGATETFTIKALFDKPDWVGKVWVDRAAFSAAVPGSLDQSVYVAAADGVAATALESAVDEVGAAYKTADVLDLAAMKEAVVEEFATVLGIVYALLALAIGIALLGIANTVALSVVERTRELGLLRAVGMSRAHLRGMVRWEAALIAVFGTLTGLVVGLALARAMVFAIANSGTAETANFVVPVGQLVVIVAIAAAAGVLAALLPARRAAKLDVLEAISTA